MNTNRAVALRPEEKLELATPDSIMDAAIKAKDPQGVWDYVRDLRGVMQVAGFNLARVVYRIASEWESEEEVADGRRGKRTKRIGLREQWNIDDDWQNVVQSKMGITPDYAKKLGRMYDTLFGAQGYVPEQHREQLQGRPVETLLAIAPAAGDLTQGQWSKVVKAPSTQAVKEIIGGIREKAGANRTSSNTAITYTQDRSGVLSARRGKVKVDLYDQLPVQKGENEEVRALRDAALARMTRALHIIEK